MYSEPPSEQNKRFLNEAESNGNSLGSSTKLLIDQWKTLSSWYLPVITTDPIWRYSRLPREGAPDQGWKLHVSATILNAGKVLEAVGPFLKSQNALYKGPKSLKDLKELNSGVFYSYTQIGKFITIYPENDQQAVYFAEQLHERTHQIPGPSVPFDQRFGKSGCVYYRYGAFKIRQVKQAGGSTALAIRDPHGKLIPDERDAKQPFPDWVVNPFISGEDKTPAEDSPLMREFRAFKALSQRGKGGVYQGLDLSRATPRLCVIKEGRRHGEVEWDGRDGYWRVRNEERVLNSLIAGGVDVPHVYASFVAGNNYYVVTEHVAGETLHQYLKKRRRQLRISDALNFAIQLAEIFRQIHLAGWLWRDCKPDNLIVTNNRIRPIDFEGACPAAQPDPFLWSTLVDKSPAWYGKNLKQFPAAADIFALGAIIFLLFEGELPIVAGDGPPKITRRNVPEEIVQLTSKMLDTRMSRRLEAKTVIRKLRAVQRTIKS